MSLSITITIIITLSLSLSLFIDHQAELSIDPPRKDATTSGERGTSGVLSGQGEEPPAESTRPKEDEEEEEKEKAAFWKAALFLAIWCTGV